MKKLLLTACAAAMFSIAAVAQEKESESNQYRETQEQQASDSVSSDFQQGVDEVEREAEEAGDEIQEGANEVEREVEEAGDEVQQESQNFRNDAEQAGDELNEDLDQAGDKIEQGAEEAGESIENTGDEIEQEMESTEERDPSAETVTPGATTAPDNTTRETDGEPTPESARAVAPQVEVIEDKEGPQSEVVYKYADEYFYVDRDTQKIVKAKESDLQEAKHDVIINEGGEQKKDESRK